MNWTDEKNFRRCNLIDKEECGGGLTPEEHYELQRLQEEHRQFIAVHCERASETVETWPAWKRGILEASSKSTNDVPRKPIP